MWAPADMFTGPLNMATLPLKRVVSYLYEHTLVLALLLLLVAAVIAIVESRSG